MKTTIEAILNRFPEVKWDRFGGDLHKLAVFGWINRDDGRSDFLVLFITGGVVVSSITSSARYGDEFADRLGFIHHPCQRVEDHFQNINCCHAFQKTQTIPA